MHSFLQMISMSWLPGRATRTTIPTGPPKAARTTIPTRTTA